MLRLHIGVILPLKLTRSLGAGKIFALVLNHHSPWTNTHTPASLNLPDEKPESNTIR